MAILFGLAVIFFWPVILGGRVLAPVDIVLSFAFFADAAAANPAPANAVLTDAALKFYPWQTVVRDALSSGQLPLWNPYIYAGTPLLANAESAVFYPINLIGQLLPLPASFGFSALLRVLIAGTGMYLFTRALGVRRLAALLAAIAFMFSGTMVAWLTYPVGMAYAWMPLMFWLAQRFLDTQRLIYLPALALVQATHFLSGHLQTSFIMLVALAAYCVFRLLAIPAGRAWRVRLRAALRPALGLLAAVCLGALLAGVQLVPFFEWLGQTKETELRLASRTSALIFTDFWKEVLSAGVGSVLPNFFGNPTYGTAISFFYSNYVEQAVYVGIVPLILAGFAAVYAARRRANIDPAQRATALFLAVAGIFFLALGTRLPPIDLLNQLPVFNIVAPERYRMVYVFFCIVLASLGAHWLLQLAREDRALKRALFAALGVALAAGLMWGAAHVAVYLFSDRLTAIKRFEWMEPYFRHAFGLTTVSMYAPILAALAFVAGLALYRAGKLSAPALGGVLVVCVACDMLIFGFGFNPAVPAAAVFPPTQGTAFLQGALGGPAGGRIFALRDDMPPNTGTPYGIADSVGFDFPPRDYLDLASGFGAELIASRNRLRFEQLDPRWLDLTSTRFVVSREAPPAAAGLREVQPAGAARIYEYERALPRAFVARRARVIPEPAAAFAALRQPGFDPRTEVVLDAAPSADLNPAADGRRDRVEIAEYGPNAVTIAANLAEAGVLVLTDAFYPGWQATVNGQPADILRANRAFRGVVLPAGDHIVKFDYRPTSVPIGIALSAAAALATAAFFVVGWMQRRPSSNVM